MLGQVKRYGTAVSGPLALLTICYVLVAGYLGIVLRYQFLRSDVLGYWHDSVGWRTPFSPVHVPGYPLLIALLRGITLDKLPPLSLMMAINAAAFLTSVWFVYQLGVAGSATAKQATLGALLFGLWPFEGVVSAVNPQADLPAIVFFLGGVYALQKGRAWRGAALLGLAVIVHKAMWPFVGLLVMAELRDNRPEGLRRGAGALALLVLPLGLVWVSGAVHYGSLVWIVGSNIAKELRPRSSLPILDGLLGTVLRGLTAKTIMKEGIVLAAAVLAAALLYRSVRSGSEFAARGGAVSLASLLLFVILNRYEIWAAVRFSRLLVLPLMWTGALESDRARSFLKGPITLCAGFGALLLSQFWFAWYEARVYFR